MKKKSLSMLLVVAMSASLLAGCGGEANNNTSDSVEQSGTKTESKTDSGTPAASTATEESGAKTKYPRNEQGYPDLQGETITIWHVLTGGNAQITNDLGEYAVIKDLEEKFNVNIEFVHPPIGQEQDNFAVMMAGNELPDMIFCGGIDSYYPGGVEMAYADGLLFDYTEYINEEYTPNFYNLISNDEFLRRSVTDDQGRIVYLGAKICGSETSDFNYSGLLIRQDYLDQAGLEVPQTIDDWTNMLQAFKDMGVKYPLGTPKSGGAGNFFSNEVFSSAYGVSAGNYFIKEDGNVGFGPYEDAYKDYLALLNSWYEAGYINPDFPTQSESDVMATVSNDETGSVIMHLWSYGAYYYIVTEEANPDKAMVAAPVPTLKAGDALAPIRRSSRSLGDKKYITADAKNPEACIALLDALYLTGIDEMLGNGVKGVNWDIVDGYITITDMPEDASIERQLQGIPQQWHTTEDTDRERILNAKYNMGTQDEALVLWAEQGSDRSFSNFVMYTGAESDVLSQYESDITTFVQENFLKFVMGQRPIDEFEQFQQELKDLHIEDVIAIKDAAQKRVSER